MSAPHQSVLREEVLSVLAPRSGGLYVDGTFGAGGYAEGILKTDDTVVYGIDRDAGALALGGERLAWAGARLHLLHGRFGEMDRLLVGAGVDSVDGVCLDLGVSSMHLDEPERGFSFMRDGPLDMRMDAGSDGPTAADIVNDWPVERLEQILREYGEERRARTIVKAIVAARANARLTRTGELAELVARGLGPVARRARIHPATRTFQALRIAVNDEMGELESGLDAAERLLAPGGRLAVVSFHSLEDRLVKRFFAARSGRTPRPSRHLPEADPPPPASFRPVTRGALTPGAAEIAANPRARSARLRAGERTDAPPLNLPTPEESAR